MSRAPVVDVAPMLARCEAATPEPWSARTWYGTDEGGWVAAGPHHNAQGDEDSDEPDSPCHLRAKADAAFIAHARTDLPAALADLVDTREESAAKDEQIATLRARLPACETCGGYGYTGDRYMVMGPHGEGEEVDEREECGACDGSGDGAVSLRRERDSLRARVTELEAPGECQSLHKLRARVAELQTLLSDGIGIVGDYSPGHDVWLDAASAALAGSKP